MALSAVAHLAALHRDLPLHDTDEEWFLDPAVRITSTGSLDPHWVGHPGSTVIYPTALFIHAWDVIAHHGSIFGGDNSLAARYHTAPTPFYLIARLWVIALSVATIPLLYLLGRRVFGVRIALVATALWSVLPYPVHFGRIVRTESAATFFAVLTLWCCVRLYESRGSVRWCLLAGVSTGLAVSSRYFMVALLPCALAAAVAGVLHDRARVVRVGALVVASAFLGFVLTTPFFFLDWSATKASLKLQDTGQPVGNTLSPLGNLRWYLGSAAPNALSWPVFLLAIAGVVVTLWQRRRFTQLLLLAYAALYLVTLSASKQHWERYLVEVMPIAVLFVAAFIVAVSKYVGSRAPQAKWLAPATTVVLAGALIAVPVRDLVRLDQHDRQRTQRELAREWIEQNVPRGSSVVQDPLLFGVRPSSIPPIGNDINVDYVLAPAQHTLGYYQQHGYTYAVVAAGDVATHLLNSANTPERQFYNDLGCGTRLVAAFSRREIRYVGIQIYRLDQRPVRRLDYFCRQPVLVH
jgi:hypothetical protein